MCNFIYILYTYLCYFIFLALNVLHLKPVSHCPTVPLPHYPTAPLPHYLITPLPHYPNVPLTQCPTTPLPYCPTTPMPHYPTTPPCYSSICTMATVNRTVTWIKHDKLVLCVLVEQLKDTDRTEGMGIKRG